MGNTVGSTWSKWDLHVHTPKSIEQNYGGDTDEVWERFVSDLEALPPEFKVLGVNDYLFVDGYEKLRGFKADGRLSNIDLLLPVVELRLDKFGGVVKRQDDGTYSESEFSRINLHIIFDQLEPELIRSQFLSALTPSYNLIPESDTFKSKWQAVITRASLSQLGEMIIEAAPAQERARYGSPIQEGFNNLCVSLEKVQAALANHNLKDKFLTAIGKAEWEALRWTDGSIAEKRNVINKVDLVFTAAANAAAYARARQRLKDAGVNDKLLDCSDAHAFSVAPVKDRIGNSGTWLKSEHTFRGLRQSVYEFEQRIYVGDKPPKRSLVNANRTKFASRLSVRKKNGSSLTDPWFDVDIPLNHDLVAVIGNKGSGKSALTDILALAGDTKNYSNFSFLNAQRFRNPKGNLAAHFEGTITWADGTSSPASLEQNPDASRVERVKYLPQSYLETLCNELAGTGSARFDGELRQIIFTHVPVEERLGQASLDDLLNFKIQELDKARTLLKGELSAANTQIVDIEGRLSEENRRGLEEKLRVKQEELRALDAARPVEVPNPSTDEEQSEGTLRDAAQLTQLESQLAVVDAEAQQIRETRSQLLQRAAHIARIVQALRNYRTAHGQFMTSLAAMLAEANIELDPATIVTLTVDVAGLQQLEADANDQAVGLQNTLEGESEDAVLKRRQRLVAILAEAQGRLSERQRLFVDYQQRLIQWEAARVGLQGTETKADTIAWLQAQIQKLDELPAQLQAARERRTRIVRDLHGSLRDVVGEYEKLYAPVRSFMQSPERQALSLDLDFKVRIVETGLRERFLDSINRTARGSFAGLDESSALVSQCIEETNFEDVEAVLRCLDRIDDMLHHDRRDGSTGAPVSIPSQLRRGHTVAGLYDTLFSLDYLSPRYSLTFNAQEISQLSPGERGLLLLVFYLLVDKDNIPLVIDQPEENLDNQTIFNVLVQCIRAAKQRRQIIMVTHNPNLAVVCDAEQLIEAECDKVAKQFRYSCGAIEDSNINTAVVKVLEGTRPAFDNRRTKYGL